VTAPREWRDLQWLLNSPSLLAESSVASQALSNSELITQSIRGLEADLASNQALQDWLQALRQSPEPLLQFIAEHRSQTPVLRLGRYAERLLEFYLRHGPTHRLEAANIALRRSQASSANADHTTVGEIDFLLRDAQGQALHWELAVKYFLCHASGPTAQAQDFIGPDRAETLESKLHKLQRQLAHQAPPPWHTERWQPQLFARGYMFYRWAAAIPCCAALHPEHLKAWWLPITELPQLPHTQFALLGRAMWMAAFDASSDSAAAIGNTVHITQAVQSLWSQAVPAGRRAPGAQLLAGLDARGEESARYFVTLA
jgi:uncharacterized protein